MQPSSQRSELRDRFFQALVGAVVPLKTGPDPEVTLEALIDAAEMLREHLEQELDEIRLEQVE
jgi:hypothetical protein